LYLSFLERADVDKASELNMMLEDLERSQLSIMTLRKENKDLHTQLNVLKTKSVVDDGQSFEKIRALEEKCESYLRNISKLSEELESQRKSFDVETQKKEKDFQRKESEIHERDSKITELELMIKSLPSREEHENIKRKLHALQALQFNDVDTDLSTQTELEQLLMQKNKSLEAQFIKIKLELTCAESKTDTLESDLNIALEDCEKQKLLISKLEEDLEKFSSKQPSESISDSSPRVDSNSEQSRFDIIVGQRDRYRKRVEILETVSNLKLYSSILKLFEGNSWSQKFFGSITN
jgi:chromosome segregation ATPase